MSYIPENHHFIENLFPFYMLFIRVRYQSSEKANRIHCPSLSSKKVDCLLINQKELNGVCIVIFNKGVNHNGQL
ncbi:hypothetical protein AOG27_20770 [Pseudoalteromonas lipolytica]|uniref:Uncharacterized protein n=1 Tax=Pseudoalteromonas lipolytica TaxID=570156 RepID=A0A0P7CNK4_9GAMM|nr:hypothetical protein AOG27_20770 [Pseudoalteromonas lipolytica]